MAFKFTWPTFTLEDYERMRESINQKLLTTPMEPPLVGTLQITKMSLGTIPPAVKLHEIKNLKEDGIDTSFKVEYNGDAYIEILSHVQINPFAKVHADVVPYLPSKLLHHPLIIPLCMHVSAVDIRGIIQLSVRQDQVSLFFQDDPLKGLQVDSSFNIIHGAQSTIQKSVEDQIRNFFMVLLPEIIVQQSEKFMNSQSGNKSS
eukprot:TRINITY_DN1332_c0_g1_i11.p1 TRINITY_DN1332_c0_g1~~TRINITY_DN1332_c0_g1_i11.p1  ORF type:complete len:203 (-),score=50.14 TRINITY_DN1332_c0_g1_i11:1795-2403(-)